MRLPLLLLLLAGCRVTADDEPAAVLGSRAMTGYHVLADAHTSIPGGDIGFLVTGNGLGGYALYWTDTAGSPATFSGSATTDVGFDPNQTTRVNGSEDVTFTSLQRIDFAGTPGDSLQGVEFVSQSDPVYFDLTVDGSHQGFGIWFTGAKSRLVQESSYNPVAFTSP
jgi:hypothetical protein